jgi:hypothetical protein
MRNPGTLHNRPGKVDAFIWRGGLPGHDYRLPLNAIAVKSRMKHKEKISMSAVIQRSEKYSAASGPGWFETN